MESTQNIKRRIRAVQNTAQITKAMEMVSANKMRRSQEIALAARPYALKALEILRELGRRAPALPTLMYQREIKNTLFVLVTADKGLAGSLNSNIFRCFEKFERKLTKTKNDSGEIAYIAVGKKSEDYLVRRGKKITNSFTKFGDYIETEEIQPLADCIINGYEIGLWDRVFMLSTHFRTTLRQDVVLREILPATPESIETTVNEIVPEYGRYAENAKERNTTNNNWEYLIEPSPQFIMDSLVRHLVETQIYALVLEANASEHSARMVAMKNASDNALELKNSLSLLYNKSRQAGITREIAEISAGAEALNN